MKCRNLDAYLSILEVMKLFSPKLVRESQETLCKLIDLVTGQDATEAFEDVGHSDEARGHLPGLLIGEFEQDGVRVPLTILLKHPSPTQLF